MNTPDTVGYGEAMTELAHGSSGYRIDDISNDIVVVQGDRPSGVEADAADSDFSADRAVNNIQSYAGLFNDEKVIGQGVRGVDLAFYPNPVTAGCSSGRDGKRDTELTCLRDSERAAARYFCAVKEYMNAITFIGVENSAGYSHLGSDSPGGGT